MIPADIRQDILHRLQRAEQEHQVRILFAIEPAAAPGALPRPIAITMCALSTPTRATGIWR